MADIMVAIATQDPYFQFAARALIGRDRQTRIHSMVNSLQGVSDNLKTDPHKRIDVLVLDLDTIARAPTFYEELHHFVQNHPRIKIFCLAESVLPTISAEKIRNIPLRGIVAKSDLGYALHVAIQVLYEKDWILVSEKTRKLLDPSKTHCISPEAAHPQLPTPRSIELVQWRIFIGLDNADIRDELSLQDDTVRGYMSDIYQYLGVTEKNERELGVFRVMSEFWKKNRFL